MLQQSAKFLLDSILKKKKFIDSPVAYLNDIEARYSNADSLKFPQLSLGSLSGIQDALEIRSSFYAYQVIINGYAKDVKNHKKKELLNSIY